MGNELPDDVELLKQHVVELRDESAQLRARNLYLEAKLARLLERRASRQQDSEPDGQLLLEFAHEMAETAEGKLDDALDAASSEPEAPPKPSDEKRGKRKRSGKRGRRPLPDDLVRVKSEFELESDDRRCSCGSPMPEIGEVTCEELARLDMLLVHQIVRKKYACNKCDDGVMVAPGPTRVLPKSMAGPSLLAWVINSKFGDYLPYYRLERILEREGAPVRRATLCNWMAGCSELLQPVADEVLRQILAGGYVQTDDTSKLIQRGAEGSSSYGHVWVYTTPDGKVYYDFSETREGHNPRRVLAGFEGFIQADAFSGYDKLFEDGNVLEVGCWAHAKRKFDDAKDTDLERAGRALAAIKSLYDIEREATRYGMSTDQRRDLRQERAPPILEAFKEWLEAESVRALARSPMATAIGYVLNQWDALCRYLEDGRIEIDNNRSERMMRHVAVGRKNDLFVFTAKTGQKATVLMSLVDSCKAHGIDPSVYLNDVLQEIRHDPGVDVSTVTPWAWKQRRDQDELRRHQRQQAQQQIANAVAGIINGSVRTTV